MLLSTPAARSALVGLVVVTLVVGAGAGLHLADRQRQARAAAGDALGARATAIATALSGATDGTTAAGRTERAFRPFARAGGGTERVLVDDVGRVLAATDADFARAVDWGVTVRRAAREPTADVSLGTARYRIAVAPVGQTGLAVAVAARAGADASAGSLRETLVWALALWGLLVGALALRAWSDGPRTAARLTAFGERIARGETDPGAMRRASAGLGTLAGAFAPVAARLRTEETERLELREHVAALYQVNPHYVLLVTLDGRIVEANPAFYAATGLPAELIRNGRIEALSEVFPVEPLLDLARRSLAEGAAIGGIDYGLVAAGPGGEDEARPVEVSLRAFAAGTTTAVVIQATDVAARRRLERRVEAFSDTLDLMVDQRVAQLTAGQQSLRRILDAAGVAVASFDAGGGTRRWSGGARALTGRAVKDVPHFASVTAALGLSDADRAAFTAWFWNPGDTPHVATHHVALHHGTTPEPGRTRATRIVWHKVEADVPGRADARTLVGAPVPADAAPGGVPGGLPDAAFVGDGRAGEVPSPA